MRRIGAGALGALLATTAINCAPHGEWPEEEAEAEAAWTSTTPPLCVLGRTQRGPVDPLSAEEDGELDAALDLARGVLALESYEQPRECHARLAAWLREDHGIDYRFVAACGVDEAVIGHARGYNAMMHRHIAERHGPVVEAAARAAGCFSEG